MTDDDFPYLDMLHEEMLHCVCITNQPHLILTQVERDYIQASIARFNRYFDGETKILAARTCHHIEPNNFQLENFQVVDAFERMQWQRLANFLHLKIRLPHKVTCMEYLLPEPLPIHNENGDLEKKLVGCVIFAKNSTHNNKAAIEFEITNLCTSPSSSDRVLFFNVASQFMIGYNGDEVVGYAKGIDNADWQLFNTMTIENIAFMQVITLLTLNQLNNDVGYYSQHYESI